MPTIVTHAAVAAAAGMAFAPNEAPARFWALAILSSTLPDADVMAFSLGIPYSHPFGHRGFFHSPGFALLMSIGLVYAFFPTLKLFSRHGFFFFLFFFLLTASHGILDAATNGGLGVALLSPFDHTRYFLPWTPIEVSPIGLSALISQRGFAVLKSEVTWVWLPAIGIVVVSMLVRWRAGIS